MKISDIKTLKEVSLEYKIPTTTLLTRINLKSFGMIKDIDYKKMGARQGVLLSPQGVKKITKGKEAYR